MVDLLAADRYVLQLSIEQSCDGIKNFSRILNCLDRFGKDLYFEFNEGEVALRTVNQAQSAYAHFTLSAGYFLDFMPQQGRSTTIKLHLESLVSIFRSVHGVDMVWLSLAVDTECYLRVQLVRKNGVKRFDLKFQEVTPMSAVYSKEYCSTRICAEAHQLQNCLGKLPELPGDALTFVAEPQCLTIKYERQGGKLDAEADIPKSSETRTEMKLSADQLYHYELDQKDIWSTTAIRVTVMQKEFRAVLQLVKDIDNRITILIERRNRGGEPIIVGTERKGHTMTNAHFHMECVLATEFAAVEGHDPPPQAAEARKCDDADAMMAQLLAEEEEEKQAKGAAKTKRRGNSGKGAKEKRALARHPPPSVASPAAPASSGITEAAAAVEKERVAAERAAAERAAAERAAEERAAEERAAEERAAEEREVAEAIARSMASLQGDEEQRRSAAALELKRACTAADEELSACAAQKLTVAGSGSGLGRSGRGGRGRGGGRGGRGVRGGKSPQAVAVAVAVADAATADAAVVSAQEPVHLTLADVGDITGRNNVAESTLGGETTCIVCFVRPKTHLAMPCCHQCACGSCAAQMQLCPYCREPVQLWAQPRMV